MSLKNSMDLENLYSRKPYLRMYDLNPSKESKTLLKMARTEGEFYLETDSKAMASSISPKKQAERLISERTIREYHLVLVLGTGNPHLLKIIDSKMREGQILLVIDENHEITAPLWEKFLFPILENTGRHLFTGENSLPLLYNYIESLPIERLTGVLFFRNPSDIQNKKEFYISIEERISKLFSSKMSDLLTKFEFERIWVKNTVVSLLRYSDLIDPEIYNQTFFTALIETVQHEDFCVFTEKTAKPIIAQRPFVVFGSAGQLKALQKLGFKTFSPVIDESYDLELKPKIRFKKVLDSMYELGKQDPLDVYEKLKEVLQHNKKHFEENDWNGNFLTLIKDCNKKIDLNNFNY
jgi:hypothetical protein